jgi:hypothetical membrane protein
MAPHRHNLQARGAALWVASIQYYIVQVVAALAWTGAGFSWRRNTISDLANTQCGLHGGRAVCSPLHPLMNLSFIVLGITMIEGALLLARRGAGNRLARAGFLCMAIAGVGTILVGIFTENDAGTLHGYGAALPFVFGNAGMIIIGASLRHAPRWLRLYTIYSGAVGLGALMLYVAHAYGVFGLGGMERIVAYPQSIWMIVYGAYLLLDRKR